MDPQLYFAFVLATTILILIPGPAVTLILATSLAHGARAALVTVAGSSSAIVIHLAITALGMTSLMLVLSEWFEWLRWAGVAYLLYLGVQQWRAKAGTATDGGAATPTSNRLYWRGFVVNATNPKTLFFYAAFFPQFVDPAGPLVLQLVVLCVTFLVIATLLDGGYALLGGRLRGALSSPRWTRLRNRLTGSLLIGAGLGLALARRT
ncbi:MAG: LysE family translocator [Rhodospirillales bacterium]|nr:LysE family translocator [Rhodospirillales bacterium]